MKSKVKLAHTPKASIGAGDFYGSGVKQKVGKIRQNMINFQAPKPKKIKVSPKNLA